MSVPHHSSEEQEGLRRRFLDQFMGVDRRTFSDGRTGPDDDGDLTFAIATDTKHGVIRIQFPKPIEWISLNRESTEQLCEELQERLLELRGIKT